MLTIDQENMQVSNFSLLFSSLINFHLCKSSFNRVKAVPFRQEVKIQINKKMKPKSRTDEVKEGSKKGSLECLYSFNNSFLFPFFLPLNGFSPQLNVNKMLSLIFIFLIKLLENIF